MTNINISRWYHVKLSCGIPNVPISWSHNSKKNLCGAVLPSQHADIKPIKFNIKNISGFTIGLNAMLHDIVLLGYLNKTIPLKSFSILTPLLQTLGYYTL